MGRIPLNLIKESSSRPLVDGAVETLAKSMEGLGLLQPILVIRAPVMSGGLAEMGFKVVAGNHRLFAARALGWNDIDAIILENDDPLETELREIDENLIRAELTASQRAYAIKRRKELWEMRHPEQVAQAAPPVGVKKHGRAQAKAFAADTAERTGQDKSSINRHVSRAEALGDDLQEITGTSLDKGVELDALKAMTPEERAPLIERAKAGEQVSARQAPKKKTFRITLKARAEATIKELGEEEATELARLILKACGHSVEIEES